MKMKKIFIIFLIGILNMQGCDRKNNTPRDNQVPTTGFERTIHLDLNGTKFAVPYGYLANYSDQQGQLWLSDENQIHKGKSFSILVYYQKEKGQWKLQPFNKQTQADFVKYLTTNIFPPTLLDVLIQKTTSGCRLGTSYLIDSILRRNGKKIHSKYPEYIIYEEKSNFQKNGWHDLSYIREGNNPAISWQTLSYNKYRVHSSSCIGDFEISYYPFRPNSMPYSQEEIISLHQQIEILVKSFLS